MTRRLDSKLCIFCPTQSSRNGEHVWPQWFLRTLTSGDGQFTTWVDQEPIRDREDRPRTQTSLHRVKVPMCDGAGGRSCGCNGDLNRRFEEPTKPLIRQLITNDGNATFNGQQATVVALWLLKTWLLLAHPSAEDSRNNIPALQSLRWTAAPDNVWRWMVTDALPPPGLSMWCHKRSALPTDQTATRQVPLPTIVVDDREVEFRSIRASISFLDVSVVYHPDWAIDHPLEREGRALRLWPRDSDQPADFTSLRPVDTRDMNWFKGPRLVFLPGSFPSSDLPPLSDSLNGLMRPPVQALDIK